MLTLEEVGTIHVFMEYVVSVLAVIVLILSAMFFTNCVRCRKKKAEHKRLHKEGTYKFWVSGVFNGHSGYQARCKKCDKIICFEDC